MACFTPRRCPRRARAVELWAALKYLGADGVDELVYGMHERALQFAEELGAAGFEIRNDVVFNQVVIVSPADNDAETDKIHGLRFKIPVSAGSVVQCGRVKRLFVSASALG